jgi:hypothetical protein
MPLNPDQRRAINIANAAKSTGPKTPAGKDRARANSLRHGLRAEILPLPNEDPTVVAARAEAWNTYYQPQSPAAQHFVNQCVAASLLADRCHRHHTSALSKQVRNAPLLEEFNRENEIDRLFVMIHSDPETAVRDLGRTAHGCRWLLHRWTPLAEAFQKNNHWTPSQLEDAIRLGGRDPKAGRTNPTVYMLKLYNLLLEGDPDPDVIAGLLDPYSVPLELAGVFKIDLLPTPDTCRREIIDTFTRTIEHLKTDEALLREALEEPDRDGPSERAVILTDPDQARLVLRYQAEARTSFHRSYNDLLRTLQRDESGPYRAAALAAEEARAEFEEAFIVPVRKPAQLAPSAPEPAAKAVAQDSAPAPVAAISPNEAKPAVVAAVAGGLEAGFGVSNGPKPIQAVVNVDKPAPPGVGVERRRLV